MLMDSNEYKKLGFKCGLEIHQRLDTKEKLFCSCSTDSDKEKQTGSISRVQKAVAGELGSIDPSAKFEQGRKRKFVYNLFRNTTCLVDIDEEPPHEVNKEALSLALGIARSLNMAIADELQPMRKEVVDGSDPSAFQRTIMLGSGGSLRANGIDIKVPSIFLEEESSGTGNQHGNEITYNVDRLGIPLIEIDTDPYIPTPEAAKEIALYIGTLLRITGKVKRGLGTIRQDVNVSIAGGERAEIKGLQDVSLIDKFIENEVRRQKELIGISKELQKRKAKVHEAIDVTNIFSETGASLIKSKIEKGGVVLAFRLEGFRGIVGKEINPDRRLGTEISDYAKSSGSHGIIHGDERLERYGFKEEELSALRQALKLKGNDSFVLISEDRRIASDAIASARNRAIYAISGIPPETRGAINDGSCTSRFLRPLPGGSRMYPETDAKPIYVTKAMLAGAEKSAPNLERELTALERQLSDPALARRMLTSTRLQLYKKIAKETGADQKFAANVLLQKFTELSRNGFPVDSVSEHRVIEMFQAYSKATITKQAIDEVLKALSKEDMEVSKLIKALSLERVTGSKLKELVKRFKQGPKAMDNGLLLKKEIMAKHRLNVDGEELNKLLV